MSGLTATFKLVDEMSDKLANIASGGQEMLSKFEAMGSIADNFFSQINDGSESAAKAVEEVSLSFKEYENSINSAADSMGYWTESVGNYDKSALEAIYTTEELVDMGLKTADALIEEGEMLGICETAAASLNELNGLSSAKAAEVVNNINENFAKLSVAKDKTATTMAEIQDDWKAKLEKMRETLEKNIVDMKMEKTAEEAARKTMEGYIKGIKEMKGSAVEAASVVANATSNALNSNLLSLKITSGISALSALQHNASGTTNSDDVFIAGEKGPELVVGAGGSTVFPADHTERIINAINRKPLQTEVPEYFPAGTEQKNYNYNETKSEKKITLEINGNSFVNTGNSFDKENAVNFLYDNIKPILINMINAEAYEEGDASYVY